MFVVQAIVFSSWAKPETTRWFIAPALAVLAAGLFLAPRASDVMLMLAVIGAVAASAGMFEHVGLASLPTYLATVRRVLRQADFINRYVFPDDELDCVSNIQLGMERAGFKIHDVEGLRPHYALTLRHWVQRLETNREAALREVDEPTYRAWRLYMAACALEFEADGTPIYQILASKRNQGEWPVPLSRRDLSAGCARHLGGVN